MPTKEDLLNKVRELVVVARDVSLAPPNPFDQVSTTAALDGLKLNGQAISDADLATLLNGIEQAKSNDETLKKVAGVVGSLLGSLAKIAIPIVGPMLCLLFMVGCGTPPPIQTASEVESKAFKSFKADHDAIVAAYHADLATALETQVRIIEDYEIKLKGTNLSPEVLKVLMDQARAKREAIATRLAAISLVVSGANKNFQIAMQMHDAIDAFLHKQSINPDDLQGLLQNVSGLGAQIIPVSPPGAPVPLSFPK